MPTVYAGRKVTSSGKCVSLKPSRALLTTVVTIQENACRSLPMAGLPSEQSGIKFSFFYPANLDPLMFHPENLKRMVQPASSPK